MAANEQRGQVEAGEGHDHPIDWPISRTYLKLGLGFIIAGSAFYLANLLAFTEGQGLRATLALAYASVAAIAWLLLARGRARAAVWILGIGVWSCMTVAAVFLGGVGSTPIIIYPTIILLAGWTVSARAAVLVALLTLAVTLAMVLAESRGSLPAPPATLPLMRWFVQACVFVLTTFLIVYFVRAYRQRQAELQALGDVLRQRAAQLEASAADLHRAQAVAHVGSWVYDLAADVMRLSAETCRIFGLPEGTAGSHAAYLSRVHAEDRAAVLAAWQAALAGGAAFDSEHRIVVGQRVAWVRQVAELHRNAAGVPERAIGTTHDITERRNAEAEAATLNATLEARVRERTASLQEANQELESFSYTISHDLRGPLRSMVGFAGLMIENLRDGPEHENRDYLERIAASGNKMSRLIDGVLDYSRLSREAITRRPVDLDALVREIAVEMRDRYPHSELVLNPLGVAHADPLMMRQILHNLIDNALKYSARRERPRVEVGVERVGYVLEYVVRDNGIGFDMRHADHLFKLFTRLHNDPSFDSTGAGLAIVKRLIDRHGGSIRAEAQPDRGASFRFSL